MEDKQPGTVEELEGYRLYFCAQCGGIFQFRGYRYVYQERDGKRYHVTCTPTRKKQSTMRVEDMPPYRHTAERLQELEIKMQQALGAIDAHTGRLNELEGRIETLEEENKEILDRVKRLERILAALAPEI